MKCRRTNKGGSKISKRSNDSKSKELDSTGKQPSNPPIIEGNWKNRPDILNMKPPPVAGDLVGGAYFVAREFEKVLMFYPGQPMVSLKDLRSLPREMQELHGYYMTSSANSAQHGQQMNVKVPENYGFYDAETGDLLTKEFTFGVDFLDLFHVFNQKCLDNNMLRLWCVYFTRESFRLKEPHVAIVDHLLFSKATIGLEEWKRGSREKAISYLSKFFAMHKQRRYVLTLYHLE